MTDWAMRYMNVILTARERVIKKPKMGKVDWGKLKMGKRFMGHPPLFYKHRWAGRLARRCLRHYKPIDDWVECPTGTGGTDYFYKELKGTIFWRYDELPEAEQEKLLAARHWQFNY